MKKTTQQRGQAMVEFALVLPLLALVLFGIIQYGLILSATQSVKFASGVGARYAVTGSSHPSNAAVQTVTLNALSPTLSAANATVIVTTNASLGGISGATSVQVQYTMPLIIPFVVPGKTNGSSLFLSATSTSL